MENHPPFVGRENGVIGMANETERKIAQALKATEPMRGELIGCAVSQYLNFLPGKGFPTDAEFKTGQYEARKALSERLLSRGWLSTMRSEPIVTENECSSIKLDFNKQATELRIPPPTKMMAIRVRSLAYVASLGSFLGMAIPMLLMWLLFRFNEVATLVGMILGGTLGAFALVMIIWHISRCDRLRKSLQIPFAVAALDELRPVFTPKEIWGVLRECERPGSGILAKIKRISYSVALILLLELWESEPSYRRDDAELAARMSIANWLDANLRLLAELLFLWGAGRVEMSRGGVG